MTINTIVQILALGGFLIASLYAGVVDSKENRIPNAVWLSLLMLYPAYALAGGEANYAGAVIVFSITLSIGFLLYSLKLFGAGDVKFFAAASLWAGPAFFADFLLHTTLVGAGLALLIWVRTNAAMLPMMLANRSISLSLGNGANERPDYPPLPYGVAIAAGAITVAYHLLLRST